MNLSVLRRAAALLALTTVMLTMAACYQPPGAVITPGDDTTATTKDAPIPTLPAKDGQLTLSLLLGVMKADMKWSQISAFDHTDVDASHATFAVADNYGKECTLDVTYDSATDVISQATLSYKEQSVDVLTDNTLVIRTIMLAMNEG